MSAISKQSLLVNNLDYTAHNIYTGLLKASYKEAFSALDKIANTLNFYLKLGHEESMVNCRNIWFKDLKKVDGFADNIKEQNYMIFGIYSVIEELGAKPAGVRNALEHRYLRISTMGGDEYGAPTFSDFTKETEIVYYKIKCAIVYLLNFINATENQKKAEFTKNGEILPIVPVHTAQWLDIW